MGSTPPGFDVFVSGLLRWQLDVGVADPFSVRWFRRALIPASGRGGGTGARAPPLSSRLLPVGLCLRDGQVAIPSVSPRLLRLVQSSGCMLNCYVGTPFRHRPSPLDPFPDGLCLNQSSGRQRATWVCRATTEWTSSLSPYETLGVDRDATEEVVKAGYRRMAKTFHPDVYAGVPVLEEGESAESRFIQIQAAYELLTDPERRQQYDLDNRTNPSKASKAWRDWVLRKKKAFEQRGDLALSAWAEQQQRELSLRARQRSKAKTDPEEERRLLAKERATTVEAFETTLKRHTLVLKKRDLVRQRAEEAARKRLVADLLAAEGFEVEDEQALG